MTPRHTTKSLDADRSLGAVIDELLELGFSRFPVYERQFDHVIGIAHIRDLLRIHRSDPARLVRDAMHPPLFVPERSRATALLTIFRKRQQHMAVVVSELGTVEGVVTLEDVLEEIVGEITDEYDEVEEELFVSRDDGSLLIAGMAPIDRVQQTLAFDPLPEDERHTYETLAGLILSLLGRMPHTGDKVEWSSWRFEVVDMDGLRIDKVLATPLPKS
jgi:putative hemolysin